MTWKQREKYDRMSREHPAEFVLKYKNKVAQLQKDLERISKDGDDASLYDEYCWCIKRYTEDIENAQLLIPESERNGDDGNSGCNASSRFEQGAGNGIRKHVHKQLETGRLCFPSVCRTE